MVRIDVSGYAARLSRWWSDKTKSRTGPISGNALTPKVAPDGSEKQAPLCGGPTPFAPDQDRADLASTRDLEPPAFVQDGRREPEKTDATRLPKRTAKLAAKPGYFVGTIHGVHGVWRRPKAGQGGAGTYGNHLTLLARFVPRWKLKPTTGQKIAWTDPAY
jgi:hypothetical protein